MKSRLLSMALLLSLAVAVVAPLAAAPSAHAAVVAAPATAHSNGIITKAKFVLHIGAAYYAFHRWVWKPYKAGQLGLSHKGNTIKAGIALLFAYHELKVAYGDTKKDAGLAKLAAPLTALFAAFQRLGDRFHSGQFSASDIKQVGSLDGLVGNLTNAGRSNGLHLGDVTVPIPGL